jgi:hypothetical protein
MTTNNSTGGRFNEEGDWISKQFFSMQDLRLSPEEYVARHAHTLGNFSFHLYRYRDPALGDWIRRVAEILCTKEEIERCRERYLSPNELAATRESEAEGL